LKTRTVSNWKRRTAKLKLEVGRSAAVSKRHGFRVNDAVLYPAHGIGRIARIEKHEVAGMPMEVFVIRFEKDKMTLRVPVGKWQSVGMQKLPDEVAAR
jgi:CarD family transcriptional regulator